MHTQEFSPSHSLLAIRGRFNPSTFQDSGNGAARNVMAEVEQSSFNRAISPMAILIGKSDDQLVYIVLNPRAT
jgi:hypothetical protein